MASMISKWKHETWNPVTGCSPVSEGCDNCYARGIAENLKSIGVQKYSNGFNVAVHESALENPLKWKSPKIVFVSSMSDLMHPKVPEDFLHRAFDVMRRCDRHVFQVLTKRPKRMAQLSRTIGWPKNVWAGTTIENRKVYDRLSSLLKVDAVVRFISFEPLLEDVSDVDLKEIHWVAVGGESGPKARPMNVQWVRALRDRCLFEGIAFYFKQWGGDHCSSGGRELDGRIWDEMPEPSGQLSLFGKSTRTGFSSTQVEPGRISFS